MSDTYVPRPPQSLPKNVSRRSYASLRCIGALSLREMASTYGRNPGGYLWAILEPVAGIAVLTFAFSFMFRSPPIGSSFALFYATGVLPFFLFTTMSSRIGSSITFSKPLLIYPAVTFVDAIIARFIVNLVTETLVFYIVIIGVLMLEDTRAVLDIPDIALSLILAALFGLGVGTLNAYLFLRFHLWHVLWSVISRPLFLISGVFFMFHALPETLRDILWYNPMIHVVGIMRDGFFPTYNADAYASPAYVVFVSLVALVIGLALLALQVKKLIHES